MNNSTLSDLSIEQIITSEDDSVRNLSLDAVCNVSGIRLLSMCDDLEQFRLKTDNLYHRVRALFFLYAIHRFHLPAKLRSRESGQLPISGYNHLLSRRFSEAIGDFLGEMRRSGPSITVSSGLAEAYHKLAIQTLADQVRRSVRGFRGNQWMFRTGHPADCPLRIRPELLDQTDNQYPILRERTAVRMDFTHCAWSDIFFLGMDFPEGAQVINASVNLAVRGKHSAPRPPIECVFRVIDAPVIRLCCVDLNAKTDVTSVAEMFDFARDYLGLVKAAVIASGIVPPGMEGCDADVSSVLSGLVGRGRGIELVSRVNDIPKGSRLAVSTNLLGSLISLCMRATGQIQGLTGTLTEQERRIVAARAILGEWIGGSGGGWQDSGGVWPGIKLIRGAQAESGDPEHGVSRGRLLPTHTPLDEHQISLESRKKLQQSLVLVHGGMAQNVGPILEMVTEKYLLRCDREWQARLETIDNIGQMQAALKDGDIREVGRLTHENFFGPLQEIIPWCSNNYTETLVANCREKFKDDFWGFWMLGGMSGGGMGFLFAPEVKPVALDWLESMMTATKKEMEDCLPFAMQPVVYDFEINDQGTCADFASAGEMPNGYYPIVVPSLLRKETATMTAPERAELARISQLAHQNDSEARSDTLAQSLLASVFPTPIKTKAEGESLDELLRRNGFDPTAHETLRDDLKAGRLGLAQNRLPPSVSIEDVEPEDVVDARTDQSESLTSIAVDALREGAVATLTLAAGVGSRWTQGAGVVKALHPFHKMAGKHRSFLDVHIAKSRRIGQTYGHFPTHIVSTGYMTDQPIRQHLTFADYEGILRASSGRSVGLRMVPTATDLQFAWQEMPQQILDEQQEKMKQSGRAALLQWAQSQGEASDYRDNLPLQCLHPVGHWYEVPNLLLNGTLAELLHEQPQLRFIMLHNVDTLGATIDPAILALHMTSGACLSFEVITRRLEDRGGGLASVDGRARLVEGLAMPSEEDEFKLSYYNSMTTWIDIDKLLEVFGLDRNTLSDQSAVQKAVRSVARRMPTFITLKDVKKRWGNGQEDVFPVCQFEKLWGDMSALPDVDCQFIVVPRIRGQQLKEQSQLDGWLREGSAESIERLCSWQ
ncbi:MAG: UTP--glucose-1-phosphate uridylyltransferase [Aureliella sp.]